MESKSNVVDLETMRRAKKVLDEAIDFDGPPLVFCKCPECQVVFGANGPFYCPVCHRNYFWVSDVDEERTGPRYFIGNE